MVLNTARASSGDATGHAAAIRWTSSDQSAIPSPSTHVTPAGQSAGDMLAAALASEHECSVSALATRHACAALREQQ